jgi:positive phototaxis protein PixI
VDKLNSVNKIQVNPVPPSALSHELQPSRQQFLEFQLQPKFTGLIEIAVGGDFQRERVRELVNIPIDRVVPMPHMPPAVMGVYNWRGEILWIVDLAMLLGLITDRSDRYCHLHPTIVITSGPNSGGESKTIGLVVDDIAEIEWYEPESIAERVTDDLPPALSRWIGGYRRSATGAKLAILDGQAIFDRADLHADIELN